MLIDKPQCNFKNCRFYFDGNCRSADIYENCKLTDLHSEIAKLTVDIDNAKTEVEELKAIIAYHKASEERLEELYSNAKAEVAREIFEEIEKVACVYKLDGDFYIDNGLYDELKKKYTEEKK